MRQVWLGSLGFPYQAGVYYKAAGTYELCLPRCHNLDWWQPEYGAALVSVSFGGLMSF